MSKEVIQKALPNRRQNAPIFFAQQKMFLSNGGGGYMQIISEDGVYMQIKNGNECRKTLFIPK